MARTPKKQKANPVIFWGIFIVIIVVGIIGIRALIKKLNENNEGGGGGEGEGGGGGGEGEGGGGPSKSKQNVGYLVQKFYNLGHTSCFPGGPSWCEDEEGLLKAAHEVKNWKEIVSAYTAKYGKDLDSEIDNWFGWQKDKDQFYNTLIKNGAL
jgi:hypothetical protein